MHAQNSPDLRNPFGLDNALPFWYSHFCTRRPGQIFRCSRHTVVTVLGPKFTAPPPLTKEDIIVFEGKDHLKVTGWTPAQGAKGALQLAILIDNSVGTTTLGTQLAI